MPGGQRPALAKTGDLIQKITKAKKSSSGRVLA
jgi:hypothetical protein